MFTEQTCQHLCELGFLVEISDLHMQTYNCGSTAVVTSYFTTWLHSLHCKYMIMVKYGKVTVNLYSASSRTCLWCATASRKSVLISTSQSVQPGTSTTLQDHWYGLVYHAMSLFTSPAFARYSFQPAAEGGLRLSKPECLILHRGGLHVQRQSPTQALTRPSVE